ncbi:unnamed protein product [Rotaria socialis]|uniref:Uncharacterized protein n=2 Tax=Rotaria socialis TaxID=392032 RepID=A0A821D888_9BILA|nr:unnamed protein product [Rotaria socialis]CAF4616772.1 unnamed protein product [Rotaria socialis]CAF4733570.1 unnamed protein product [Rotaria socialis]
MLNTPLNIHRHTSFISLHNPTNEVRLLLKDYSLVQKNIFNLIQHITNAEQKDKVKRILDKYAKLFDTTKPTIVINVKPHAIKTLDYPPPSSKPYYSTPAKQDSMYKITQECNKKRISLTLPLYAALMLVELLRYQYWHKELFQFELIRPSYSPDAAQLFIGKSTRVNNWAGELTTNNSTLSSSRRQNMINYAIYNVFLTTYWIRPILRKWIFQQLKNTRINDLFISFKSTLPPSFLQKTKKLKKMLIQKFVNALLGDDELEPISDDEIYVNQLVGPVKQAPPAIEEISDDEQQLTDQLLANDIELIIHNDGQVK